MCERGVHVCVCVREACMCVWVCERERGVRVCVGVWREACVFERDMQCVCVCVRERHACMCVCE